MSRAEPMDPVRRVQIYAAQRQGGRLTARQIRAIVRAAHKAIKRLRAKVTQ